MILHPFLLCFSRFLTVFGLMKSTIISLKDINLEIEALHGKTIRTWGKINSIDRVKDTIIVQNGDSSLLLDTHFLLDFDGQRGELGQYIGEIRGATLTVKSFRSINELDLKLFELSLEKKNVFLRDL